MTNIAKVQIENTFDYQRNRINDAIDVINNMRDGVVEVNTEASLPSPSSAPTNIYLIKNHSQYKGSVLALLNGSSYIMVPLRNDPINSNNYAYYTSADFGSGIAINKLVYLDSTKHWQLADCTNSGKKAMGIVGPYNSVVLSGIVKSTGLTLTPGATYYYDNTGTLTTTQTNGYVGFALDTNILDVNIRDKQAILQSDWNQTNTEAEDYIKNKPGTVTKQADGFVPQLPNETTVTKFFRQDGSWAVPAYPTPGVQKTGDAMTGTLSDVGAAQVRNVTILTSEGSTGNNGWLYAVIEQ